MAAFSRFCLKSPAEHLKELIKYSVISWQEMNIAGILKAEVLGGLDTGKGATESDHKSKFIYILDINFSAQSINPDFKYLKLLVVSPRTKLNVEVE